MKLNKDCVRDILMYVEEHSVEEVNNLGTKQIHTVNFDELCKSSAINYENDIIHYALEKMKEYHLINFNGEGNTSTIDEKFTNYHIAEITDYGHEFLDNVKSDEAWEEMKKAIEAAKINDCSLNLYYKYIHEVILKRLNKE